MTNERNESKHTPGPWNLAQFSTGAEVYGNMRGINQMLAAINSCRHDDPEGNANAHLIAAAPDLLEALQEFLRWSEEHNVLASIANPDPFGTTYTATRTTGTLAAVKLEARAAIAKATAKE